MPRQDSDLDLSGGKPSVLPLDHGASERPIGGPFLNLRRAAERPHFLAPCLVLGNSALYDSSEIDDDNDEPDMQPDEQTGHRKPPPSPIPLKSGVQRSEFPLAEGVARIEFPAEMSPESYEDLEAWTQLVLRRAKRSVI